MSATPGKIAKVDEDQRLVFGWAYIAADKDGTVIIDKQGDFIDDPEELAKAAYDFVLESREGDLMHTEIPVSRLVESIVFTPEKLEKMGVPEGTMPTGWWVGFYVDDDDVWAGVKKGTWGAFSIGGQGVREKVDG